MQYHTRFSIVSIVALALANHGCLGSIRGSVAPAEGGDPLTDAGQAAEEAGVSRPSDAGSQLKTTSAAPPDAATVDAARPVATDAGTPNPPRSDDASVTVVSPVLQPMPLISTGRPIVASVGEPSVLVNYTFFDVGFWDVSPASKPWVALDLGKGPKRIYVQIYSSQPPTVANGYHLDVSTDSTNGRDGTWKTEATVTGNTYTSTVRVIDFVGSRWLRVVVDAAGPDSAGKVQLNEVAVYDASAGTNDSWVFIGDSITAMSYAPGKDSFSDVVHAQHPAYQPLMCNVGVGGTNTNDGVAHLADWLAAYPAVQNWIVSYGTNDSASGLASASVPFGDNLRQIVLGLQAAGKSVYVPTIPWRTGDTQSNELGPYNAVLEQVVAETGAYPGPDLHAYFALHPEQLADGVHPNEAGSRALSKLWADAVSKLYR